MKCLGIVCMISGLVLLIINTFGLTKTLRNPEIYSEQNTRFKQDITIDHKSFMEQIVRHQNESDKDFSMRINNLIQQGIAHTYWKKIDVNKYYQKIPIWENFILYALSYSPFFDDYKRYHFSDYKKSIERGIGNCGDAALILSGILEDNNIDTIIASFQGHVIAEVLIDKEKNLWWLLDPDFGVVISHDLQTLLESPESVSEYYRLEGYTDKEINGLISIYLSNMHTFENVYNFGPTKMIVEYISYVLKWVIPLCLLLIGCIIFCKGYRYGN